MSDETAIVTGAGGGIGKATSLRLARDGYHVHALDLSEKGLELLTDAANAEGLKVTTHVVDLRDVKAMEQLVESIDAPRVLVNNAGIFEVKDFFDLTADDFHRNHDINLLPAFVLSHAVARRMPQGGRIINLASRAVLGGKSMAPYIASKAAVVGLTRAMAVELADLGITVNGIAPGPINTNMATKRPDMDVSALLAMQPIKRIGCPEEIAHVIAFFASSDSGYITGQTLLVDGGRSLGAFGV